MSFGRYAIGVIALLCVLLSLGGGALALRRVLVPDWRGAAARLAEIVLGLALLVLTLQLLGTVGLFRLVPIVAASVAVGLGLTAWGRRRTSRDRTQAWPAPGWGPGAWLAVGLALVAAGVVLAEWAGPTLQSFDRGIVGADSVAYHLPWAASFAQTHQITSIRYTDIEWLTGFYPATYELLHGLGIALMGSDVLSPGMNLMWLALVLLAAWCIGDSRGLGPAALLGGAVAMAAPMMFFSTAGTADNDVAGVFFLVAAVALWVNATVAVEAAAGSRGAAGYSPDAGEGGFRAASLLPAAAAAGLALSVKLNLFASVIVLTAAVIAWAPAGSRGRVVRIWAGGLAVSGGYWYLRNLFAVGNPLPYFSFGVLPTPDPGPTQAHNNFAISDYLTYPRIITHVFTKTLAQGLGPWWVEILLVTLVGAGLCFLSGRDRVVRLISLVALVSLAAYLFTPGSASGPWGHPRGFGLNLRYVAPALTVALAATPLAGVLRGRRMRWVVLVGFAVMLLASVAQRRLWGPGYDSSGQIAAATLLVLVGVGAVLKPWSAVRVRPTVRRVGLATAAITLALAGAAAGYGGERHYLRGRYVGQPGLKGLTQLWQWARRLHDQRIALAGTLGWYFGYPLYGPDDSNQVVYLGHRGTHGSFRPITSCQAWRTAINAGHYRYIVAAAARTMWTGAIRSSPEGNWTRTDPAVRLVFPRAGKPWVVVYAVSGRLNPAGCRDAPPG